MIKAAMTFQRALPISMVLAVLGSHPTPAPAAFPEEEFSTHDREWRHDRREIRQGRQNDGTVGHDTQQRLMDERHRPGAGLAEPDRHDRRHAREELRQNRQDRRADHQNRQRNRRAVRKERSELQRDWQDLRAGHRGFRADPPPSQ